MAQRRHLVREIYVSFRKLAALLFGLVAIMAIANLVIMRSVLPSVDTGPQGRTGVAGGQIVLSDADRRARAGNSDLPPLPEPPTPATAAPAVDLAPMPAESPVATSAQQPASVAPEPATSSHPAPPPPTARTGVSFTPGQPMIDPNPSR
jgi:hypothetical protein